MGGLGAILGDLGVVLGGLEAVSCRCWPLLGALGSEPLVLQWFWGSGAAKPMVLQWFWGLEVAKPMVLHRFEAPQDGKIQGGRGLLAAVLGVTGGNL